MPRLNFTVGGKSGHETVLMREDALPFSSNGTMTP